jgi:transposase
LRATKNQRQTAILLGMSVYQVNRIMHKYVSNCLSNRTGDEVYANLSIDEKCVGRGHKYISVLSDSTTGKVIEITEGRSQDSADKLCSSLSFEQRSMVETVCTDMWQPYITTANKQFPNAKHCFDNFHLVGYLNKAVDSVRRREVKYSEDLRHTKYIFLKDKSNFTNAQKEKFESIKNTNYSVSIAWRVKENFRAIRFKQ